jgi:hypothetical protein
MTTALTSDAIWIGYTTRYREGGPKFTRAAHTLAADKRREFPHLDVRCEPVESKAEFLAAMRRLSDDRLRLRELHLVTHSGMYGPMFGSAVARAVQPARVADHGPALRDRRRGVLPRLPLGAVVRPVLRADPRRAGPRLPLVHQRVRREGPLRVGRPRPPRRAALHLRHPRPQVARPARLAAQVRRPHRPEAMQRFEPQPPDGDASYDSVAALYDDVFADIRVRGDEWSLARRARAGGRARARRRLRQRCAARAARPEDRVRASASTRRRG